MAVSPKIDDDFRSVDLTEAVTVAHPDGTAWVVGHARRGNSDLSLKGPDGVEVPGVGIGFYLWADECPHPPKVDGTVTDTGGRVYRVWSCDFNVTRTRYDVVGVLESGEFGAGAGGGGAGLQHSALSGLDYTVAGHTGFAGTGVPNTFAAAQSFPLGVTLFGSPFPDPTGQSGVLTAAGGVLTWAPGGGSAWGGITGTLSDQTDLATALSGKQTAYPVLSALGGLANAAGWLHDDGAGVLTWSTPTKADVGLSNVPNADATNAGNISSGTLPAARLPPPTGTTLGGVKSASAATHQFQTGIDTSGNPTFAQPAAGDVSGLGTAATHATGDFAQTANNLSDLASATTARTNLGVPSGSGTSTGTNTGDQFTATTDGRLIGRAAGSAGLAGEIAVAPTLRLSSGKLYTDKSATALATSGAVTVDRSVSNEFIIAPTGNVTLSLSNDYDGAGLTIFVRASSFTITWWSGIKWTGGTAPTLPTVTGHVTAVGIKRIASGEYWGTAAQEAY